MNKENRPSFSDMQYGKNPSVIEDVYWLLGQCAKNLYIGKDKSIEKGDNHWACAYNIAGHMIEKMMSKKDE